MHVERFPDVLTLVQAPACLVNIDGYFDGIIMQLERAYKDKILYQPAGDVSSTFCVY